MLNRSLARAPLCAALALLALLSAPPAARTCRAQQQEEDEIKPSRPSVADPAEIQKPGVLQLELGYDANLRSRELRDDQTVPVALRFAAAKRLLLEVQLDAVKSERDAQGGPRMTGVGDTRLGFQIVALEEAAEHPAVAFAYHVKLPTADEREGLGTGRFDHRFTGLLSKKVGATDIDFNVSYLLVGKEGAGGWEHGGAGALSFSREFENSFGVEGELSGQSHDDAQPRGLFALGALTYKAGPRLQLDAGLRFGLNPEAPRVGLFAGLTVGLGNLYGKK